MAKSLRLALVVFPALLASVSAQTKTAAPKDVPPVIGKAVTVASAKPSDRRSIQLVIPKVAWRVIGERRAKREWPRFTVTVTDAKLVLPVEYDEATALNEDARNRVLNLQGEKLSLAQIERRLRREIPVLVSVSGNAPDPFYLQCTKPDTLIVVLGIPTSPAPELLPLPAAHPTDNLQAVIPQAEPVAAWIKAVKTSDVALFKTVWSKRLLEKQAIDLNKEEHSTWEWLMKHHAELWTDHFQGSKVADFTFSFKGGNAKGEVTVKFQGKEIDSRLINALPVIKENGTWKMATIPGE